MKRLLFAWELGAGQGHLLPHVALLKTLQQQGYEIHAAVKDLSKIVKAFGDFPCAFWQAPVRMKNVEQRFTPTFTFPQILHNVGMGDVEDLTARITAWRNLLRAIKPEVIIADYAPTLLLALRGEGIICHGLNTGFFFPPPEAPLSRFSIFPKTPMGINLIDIEDQLLTKVNSVLGKLNIPKLENVAGIFQRIDHRWLMTIPELDHFKARPQEQYLGISTPSRFHFPGWPGKSPQKIFCYLKPFAAINLLLEYLSSQNTSVVITSDGLSVEVMKKFTSENMKFSTKPLDLAAISEEATLSVTNANHATAGYLLLKGIPQLSIPITLEQQLLAQRIYEGKWGLTMNPKHQESLEGLLQQPVLQRNQSELKQLVDKHQPIQAEDYFQQILQVVLK